MKRILIVFFGLASLASGAQDSKTKFDGQKWEAPYTLDIPKGWDVERFLIPIEFAPQIPYKGVEDIRFTRGWGNAKAPDYWTYAFLWFLDGSQKMNSKIIEDNLRRYYEGLIGRNIEPRKIPADKLFPVRTKFKKAKAQTGDVETFRGTIYMLDYMEQKPMTLYATVHVRTGPGLAKTFVFNEISPKNYDDGVWQGLDQLWTTFNCDRVSAGK